MKYILKYSEIVVKKDIPALPENLKPLIKTVIEGKLTFEPAIFGKPLRKSLKGCRRLRVQDYRVVFRMEKKTVEILAIRHRSEVYEQMEKRV